MPTDKTRLVVHVSVHSDVADTYAKACRSVAGSAYSVELRTLSAAHHTIARRLEERLRTLGGQPYRVLGQGLVDIAALSRDPATGVGEILRGENVLVDELVDTLDTPSLSLETHRLVATSLRHVRAHVHRVERFQTGLSASPHL